MIYKFTSGVFIITTTVFAGLYFSGENGNLNYEGTSAKVEVATTAPQNINRLKEEKQVNRTPVVSPASKPPKIIYKEKVIIKESTAISDEDKSRLEKMTTLHDHQIRIREKGILHRNTMLFSRLNLDEVDQKNFVKMLAERDMIRGIQPQDMNNDEQEVFNERKKDMLNQMNDDISEFLGDEKEVYQRYEEMQLQYGIVANLKDQMVKNGEFEIPSQDQLVEFMHDSRKGHDDFFQGDYKHLKESKESADIFLVSVRERYDEMISTAPVNGDQKEVLANYLNGVYKHYEKTAEQLETVRLKGGDISSEPDKK